METRLKKYCQVLGLPSKFGLQDLKLAYRKQMLLWHPDRHIKSPEMSGITHEQAKAINEAYEFFSCILESQSYIDLSVGTQSAPSRPGSQQDHYYQRFRKGFPDPSVFEVFVESSNVFSIGYNRDLRILYIKFKRKHSDDFSVYRYFNVPETVFHQMLAAESKGKFVYRFVAHTFQYEYMGKG